MRRSWPRVLLVLAVLLTVGSAAVGLVWHWGTGTTQVATSPPSAGTTAPAPPPAPSTSAPATSAPATSTPATSAPATSTTVAPTTSTSATAATSTTAAPPTTAAPTTTTTTSPAPTTTTTAPVPPATLSEGMEGPAVLDLQRRLAAQGYWLGQPDGEFGPSTFHAVVAFQKANGLERDGVAGLLTQGALAASSRPRPRSGAGTGRVAEVDLARQLVLISVDGRVDEVLDASTGTTDMPTPVGRFRVYRQVDGYDPGPLGVLYRPKYFTTDGVALHGFPEVPARPASHGCVRVTDAAIDWVWATGAVPVGTPVWVY